MNGNIVQRHFIHYLYTCSLIAPSVAWSADALSAQHDAPPKPDFTEPYTEFDVTQSTQRKTERDYQQQNDDNHDDVATQINHQNEKDSLKTLSLSKAELLKQPELLYRALSSAVLMRDVAAIGMLLPIYQKLPEPRDDVLENLATALLERHRGNAGKAAQSYQKVLEKQPNMASVKLGLAQSLFDDKQNKAADEAFAKIEAEPDLPDNVRELSQSYRKILKKRNRASFYASAHYTQDKNVNNAPKLRAIKTRNGEWKLPESQSAHGFSYRAGMSKDTILYQNYRFRTNAELWGKFYWDNHNYDDVSARVSAGVAREDAKSEVALLPYYERRWFGTEKYAAEKGVRAEASRWLNPKNQVILASEIGRVKHDKRQFLDGNMSSGSATLLHVSSKNQYFSVGLDMSRKSAKDSSDAYRRRGMRAAWTRHWRRSGFSTVLSANYGVRHYDANDFFNIVRKDKELTTTLSVWHKKVQLWGIQPRVVAVYHRNDSNHFLYDYRKAYAFVQLSKSI